MKVILFGATGMIGRGVLRACLRDEEVESVLAVGRRATGVRDAKLRELAHRDFSDLSSIQGELAGHDACFYCLGVSSAGMAEADYTRVTYDYALATARALVAVNAGMTFIFVSGAGTDAGEQGRVMWARVKGKTENALLKMPFAAAYMFRPAFMLPQKGVVAGTAMIRALYAVMGPLYPLLKRLFPAQVTTTEQVGEAMIEVALHGAFARVLESRDIVGIRRGRSGG